jgi:hypothetical protein
LTKARTRKKISRRNVTYYGIGRLEKPVILQTVRKKIVTYKAIQSPTAFSIRALHWILSRAR